MNYEEAGELIEPILDMVGNASTYVKLRHFLASLDQESDSTKELIVGISRLSNLCAHLSK